MNVADEPNHTERMEASSESETSALPGWMQDIARWIVRHIVEPAVGGYRWVVDKVPSGWKRQGVVAALVMVYLAVDTARRRLDAAITKINPAGEPGVGTDALHDGEDAVLLAFDTWERGWQRLRQFIRYHPVDLAVVQSVLELVVVCFSAFLLFGVVHHLRSDLDDEDPDYHVLTLSLFATLGYLAFGIVNEFAELGLLWRRAPLDGLTWELRLGSYARRILLALVLIPSLVVVIRRGWSPASATDEKTAGDDAPDDAPANGRTTTDDAPGAAPANGQTTGDDAPDDRSPTGQTTTDDAPDAGRPSGRRNAERWWESATVYRTVLIVAGLYAVLLLVGTPGRQAEDALRLWASNTWLAIAGVVATAVLAVMLALYATRLGSSVVQARIILDDGGTKAMTMIGAVAIVGGGLLYLADSALAPVVLAVGLVLVVIGLLSIPLPKRKPSRAPRGATASARQNVPAVVAFVPFAALTVALVRAAVPTVLDRSAETAGWAGRSLFFWAVVTAALGAAAYPLARQSAVNDLKRRAGWRKQQLEVKQERGPAEAGLDESDLGADTSRVVEPKKGLFRTYAVGLLGAGIGLGLIVIRDPVERAPTYGVIAIAGIFLAITVGVIGTLAVWLDGGALPAALDFVGFRKVPVVTGLVVVGLLSQWIAGPGYHDVDAFDTPRRPDDAQLTIEQALDQWVHANAGVEAGAGDLTMPVDADRPGVPLVFVTAAGGGIKAAAFTATVLDCVFAPTRHTPTESDESIDSGATTEDAAESADLPADEPGRTRCADDGRWDDVFVASGASGGSVGIASVIAERSGSEGDTAGGGWVPEKLGQDLLSASLAWQLFVEVPNAIAAFHPTDDRAAVLEASWREQFGLSATDMPFYVDRTPKEPSEWLGPLPFFSGTNLNDGCRVNVSPVRSGLSHPAVENVDEFGPTSDGRCTERRVRSREGRSIADLGDAYDLSDYLCNAENIDLATAGFLSARFPYVSPTATVTCDEEKISIGDGGYRDNSGASTVLDLWSVLSPTVRRHNLTSEVCIVPIWLEIGTGYAGFTGDGTDSNVAQVLAPPLGAAAVFGDLSYGAVEQLAAEFTRPLDTDLEARIDGRPLSRHFRVSLVDHPGVTAPLGWSLSREAAEDFRQQLDVSENQDVIGVLDDILGDSQSLTCGTVAEQD